MVKKTTKLLSVEKRFDLIKRNTAEIITEDSLKKLIKTKKKPVVYLGTAPTGRPHVGYFIWGLKLADLLRAGFHVKVLLADLHAALDNTPWNVLEKRYDYYALAIPEMLKAIGADIKELEIVKGSEMQLKPEYMYDVLKMSSIVSVHDTKKAASDVVKLGDNPKLSGLIYPLMQACDEQYLEVDCQLGGTDQRKIMVLARESLPKIGYDSRIEIMTPLLPGLIGEKMSASDPNSKIDLLDDEETIKKKINKADFIEGNCDNGIISFLEYFLMVIKGDNSEKLLIKRPNKFGGDVSYLDIKSIKEDVISKKLHPQDLKLAVALEISNILSRIDKKKLMELSKKAYSD
ncbi:tyrosine--tRNA ligase [Candidatus Pacearchaeota archaeon]|nr:tyrosine--tRNA ligase [Candidatus Pacearchaeota archaeon]